MLPAYILVLFALAAGNHVVLNAPMVDPRSPFATEAECRDALTAKQKDSGGWVVGACVPGFIVR